MSKIMVVAYGAVAAAGVTLMLLPPRNVQPTEIAVAAPTPPLPAQPADGTPAAPGSPTASAAPAKPASDAAAASWTVPDIDKLPDNDWGRTVR